MESVRPTYWNVPSWAQLLVYLLGALALGVFAYGVYRHIRKWRLGKPELIEGSVFERLKTSVTYALFQWRLSSDRFAIVMHLMIFWGMAILFLGTILATVDWDITHLVLGFQFLKGSFYLLYELTLDIFGVLLILGLGMAMYRRYILRPERLKTSEAPTFRWDSFYLLIILLLVDVTGFILEGLRIAAQNPLWASWAPVGFYLSTAFRSLPFQTLASLHFFFWSFHLLLAVVFIASIPYTKAFHVISSPISIYLGKLFPAGGLIAAGDSGIEKIGDFTWRQLLQLDACTWCGRCQDICPAYASGFSLSPKKLVLRLDAQLLRSIGANGSNPGPQEESKRLHGSVVSASELWACTTCGACEKACPVFIEHPRVIVEMRRHLVSQGQIGKELQDTLLKVGRYGNSFGQSDRLRAKWTQGLEFKIKDARKEPVEYLWFVGDYASYDPRIQDITRMTARIFEKAGLDFGTLFEGERNSGNDVRRIGEEGMFETLKEKNLQAIEKGQFKKIVTTDPHTYNALKNEYGLNGGSLGKEKPSSNEKHEVKHHTEVLDELIQERKLRISRTLNYAVTYHDPCYLGRYNGIYDAPRRILKALGAKLVEMPRNRSTSYCCGAGGGRIWMGDEPGIKERPAENRIREAVSLQGVQTLVVSCPKDVAMFQDAVKTTGNEGKITVKELSNLVYEAVE